MCNPASFRVLRDRAIYSKIGDSHEQIVKEHDLRATDPIDYDVLGVPVEIVPENFQYNLPTEQWKFAIDSTVNLKQLPDWWNSTLAEKMCRDLLPDWWSYHVISEGIHDCGPGRSLIVIDGHATITQSDGELRTCGQSANTITQSGGILWTYDQSANTITQSSGDLRTYDQSANKVIKA